MKIGIVTFHRSFNYGAFLQAFALKSFLERKGHNVSFVDYQSAEHAAWYKLINPQLFKKSSIKGKIYMLLMAVLSFGRTTARQSKMRRLQSVYLGVKGNSYDDINKIPDCNYDAVIYGSDQIWRKSSANPGGGFGNVYWGDGVNSRRKIAYAPSMGILDISKEDEGYIKSHLNKFDALSCRENNLKLVLEKISGKEIEQVVDPVFLLSREEWEKHCRSELKYAKEKYVLVYNLMHSTDVDRLAARIAKERGLKVIEITGSVQPMIFRHNVLQTLDTFDFITMIRNASFVVASSFHAIAFSIIFRRNFYALGLGKNGGRVASILELAGIGDRLVSDDFAGVITDVDYNHDELTSDIVKSTQYLDEALAINPSH